MLHEHTGNLLSAGTDALVNTVNTEGVMGKGIALQFKRAFPEMFRAYAVACAAGQVRLGSMWVWHPATMHGPRIIVNFPTKGHWRSRSRLGDIERGLSDLVAVIEREAITSIAVPPLGCGNGGLSWSAVRPLIIAALGDLPEVDVHLYPPAGPPAAAEMITRTRRPTMSPGKAALVLMLDRYRQRTVDVSLIETHKLMYFLQEAGQDLRLKVEKQRYGPYAVNLSHVLKAVEGHFLSGFGDGSQPVRATEPIEVLPGAAQEAEQAVSADVVLSARIERVLDLVRGFESPFDMELLSSVHWVATREDPAARIDPSRAGELVRNWNERKQELFPQRYVETAWARLDQLSWLGAGGEQLAVAAATDG